MRPSPPTSSWIRVTVRRLPRSEWEEALERAGGALARIRDHGRTRTGGLRLRQGLERGGLSVPEAGAHGLRHQQRRPLHAALPRVVSVAALLEGIGSGAVSNQVSDVEKAEVMFLIGANPTSNHPVAATWMKNAVKSGTKLIFADPRRSELARHAWRMLQFKPDTDVALLNAMIHTIIDEGLVDEEFVARPHQRLRSAEGERRRAFARRRWRRSAASRAETHPRGGARLRHVARAR